MKDEKDYRAGKTTMEVPVPLANMVRFLADHHDITIPEVWERFAQPVITREFKKATEKTHVVIDGEG